MLSLLRSLTFYSSFWFESVLYSSLSSISIRVVSPWPWGPSGVSHIFWRREDDDLLCIRHLSMHLYSLFLSCAVDPVFPFCLPFSSSIGKRVKDLSYLQGKKKVQKVGWFQRKEERTSRSRWQEKENCCSQRSFLSDFFLPRPFAFLLSLAG